MEKVVLIGTEHSIQRGERAPAEFKAMLLEECKKHGIEAIAEEIEKNIESVAFKLTKEIEIDHLYADPDKDERVKRGIKSDCRCDLLFKYRDQYPQLSAWPKESNENTLPPEVWQEYSRRTNESYRKREKVWLDKILKFNKWPLLFICGADHFFEFSKLLERAGYSVVTAHEDWAQIHH